MWKKRKHTIKNTTGGKSSVKVVGAKLGNAIG